MSSAHNLQIPQILAHRPSTTALASGLRNIDCPLCGSSETRYAFTDAGCELRCCAICDLFFVHPYPSSDRNHENVQSGANPEIQILDCESRHQGEQHYYDRHFSSIEEECAGVRSVLDVGCGTGHLLERLARRPGLHCAGVELNAEAAQFAAAISGCEISKVPFERFANDKKFDVITLINVFSHIPAFDGLFNALRRNLNPGGKVILRTAEMSADISRWNQIHWGIPDDLHFLGLRTLDFLCAKYGFIVTRHDRLPYEEELFLPSRWRQMGRSRVLNAVKFLGVNMPGALPALKKIYTEFLGQRIFISFIVLTPLHGPPDRASRAGMRAHEST